MALFFVNLDSEAEIAWEGGDEICILKILIEEKELIGYLDQARRWKNKWVKF